LAQALCEQSGVLGALDSRYVRTEDAVGDQHLPWSLQIRKRKLERVYVPSEGWLGGRAE